MSDQQRLESDLRAWETHLEQSWCLPASFWRQGLVSHLPSGANRAIWTAEGGIIECEDEVLARQIATVIEAWSGRDHGSLLSAVGAVLRRKLPETSYMVDASLNWRGAPGSLAGLILNEVEPVLPGAEGLPDLPEEVEHVFAIRIGGRIASWVSNIPVLKIGDHWLYGLRVETHRDYRRKGLGKAVVSALLEHIAAEEGSALWVCKADNEASFRMALSLGFAIHFYALSWKGKLAPSDHDPLGAEI